MPVRDVIIVGAGPSGLAAAIAAKKHGLDYQVLEQGMLVNSIFHFPTQMVFFTTPELMEIGGLPFVSPYDKPTRAEALRYYRAVADTYDLQIAYDEKVISVTRDDDDADDARTLRPSDARGDVARRLQPSVFAVETRSSKGVRRARHGRFVVLAIGYYDHPVLLGIPGEELPHVFHYQQEPHPYFHKRVVVVGGGNSAAEAALELFRSGAHVTLVHRNPELKSTIKYWVRPDIENRIREKSIDGRFNALVREIRPAAVVIETPDGKEEIPADAVFLLTGYRADTDLMVRAGIELTPREAPECDPMTFETNVPGIFVAGGAIAGVDTGTVFIENGRFHGERIIEAIAARIHP